MRSRQAALDAGLVMLIALTIGACASRYRMDFFIDLDETRKKIDVDGARLIENVDLGDPLGDDLVEPGASNVAVVSVSTRWERNELSDYALFKYDENLRFQIYLQLPEKLRADSSGLPGQSFAQRLGRYDQPPGDRTYIAESGFWRIDSLASGKLFVTLQGDYSNYIGGSVTFDGRFKVKAQP